MADPILNIDSDANFFTHNITDEQFSTNLEEDFNITSINDGLWQRIASVLSPATITDKVAIGATAIVGTERLRVLGDIRLDGGLTFSSIATPLVTSSITTDASNNIILQDSFVTIALKDIAAGTATYSTKGILSVQSGTGLTLTSGVLSFNTLDYYTKLQVDALLLTPGGTTNSVQYNTGSALGGDSNFTYNTSTGLLTTYDLLTSNYIYVQDLNSSIDAATGELRFTDAVSGSVLLSTLLGGATNYWTTTTGGIYYANYISNHVNPTAEVDITGHIIATDFDSNFLRYKSSNLLLGPNAGDNETGSGYLYIANTNTSTPLIYGEFPNTSLYLNADVYVQGTKTLNFSNANVRAYWYTGDNLAFQDSVANSGNMILLTELIDGTYNVLGSSFTDLAAVQSITSANKTTWNKASILTTAGAGTLFLSDDGSYQAVGGGGVTPISYTWKWEGTSLYYYPYTSKTDAGGVASAGRFWTGTDDPTATNRLNYDGYFYPTQLFANKATLSGTDTNLIITNTSSSGAFYGIDITNNTSNLSAIGEYIRANIGVGLLVGTTNLSTATNSSNDLVQITRTLSGSGNHTGNFLKIIDNPTGVGTFSGAFITGIVGTTERLRFDPKVVSTGSATSSFIDTHNLLVTGDKVLSIRNQGTEMIYLGATGTVNGHRFVATEASGIVASFSATNTAVALSVSGAASQTGTNLYINGGTALLVEQKGSISGTYNFPVLNIQRINSGTGSQTGNLLQIIDNPTLSGTISGALISGTISTTERLRFNPRVANGATAVGYFIDTHNDLATTGSKIFSIRNQGTEVVFIDKTGLDVNGKLTVSGLIDPTGLQFDPVVTNPGTITTLWADIGARLYYGPDRLGLLQSTGLTYNPANPFKFDNSYQYNNYTVSTNITPTSDLTGAIPLNGVSIVFVGDGTHTVDFSNFTESYASGTFDSTLGAENQVMFYYNGNDVYYTIGADVKLDNVSATNRFLGRITAGAGNIEELTGTQATTLLDNFTTSLKGLVPGSGGGTTNFLRADGTWTAPPSSVTPIDDILDWSTNKYTPFATHPGATTLQFYLGTTNPTGTTRLNLNGVLYTNGLSIFGTSPSGLVATVQIKYTGTTSTDSAILGYTTDYGNGIKAQTIGLGSALSVSSTGNLLSSSTNNLININRGQSGSVDITGDVINIVDYITNSGVKLGKILSATIEATERISLNPRVASGSSAIAYFFDTHNNITSTSASIVEAANQGVSVFKINPFGEVKSTNTFQAGYTTGDCGVLASTSLGITKSSVQGVNLTPNVTNGATAIGFLFNTFNDLNTTGAKLVSIKNNNVEKLLIDKDGSIEGGGINFKITAEGGYAVKLIAGEALNKGEVVYINPAGADNNVYKAPTSNEMPIGIVYATVTSTSSVWIVVSGIAEVLPETGITAVRGDVIYTSASQAGRVEQAASVPVAATHFRECGHFLANGSGAGVLTKAILHFN
jgi:hypothetical protein